MPSPWMTINSETGAMRYTDDTRALRYARRRYVMSALAFRPWAKATARAHIATARGIARQLRALGRA